MIRAYLDSDSEEVVRLVQLNTPKYFHISEEQDLRNYLANEKEDYFIVESNGEIIAAAQEERFSRKKHDSSFPKKAIECVLKEGNLKLNQILLTQYLINH